MKKTTEAHYRWRAKNPAAPKATIQRAREKRCAVVDAMKDQPCSDCGVQYPPYVMQFDHRDPSTKSFGIAACKSRVSLEDMMLEVQKCDLVCANCHAERTHRQREAQ